MTHRMQETELGKKQAVLIVGMHRSGTSALARVINLLGVPLGERLAQAAYDNETGFWESEPVVALHDQLFDTLGSAWDDPRPLPEKWLDLPSVQPYRDRLFQLLDEEFGSSDVWGVKDPRLCRFLSLWQQVLARKKTTPKLVLAVRHPDEVVASLVHRNRLAPGVAAALWLRYLSDSVEATQGLDRCIIGYAELLDDWPGCVERAASELGITWPASVDACRKEVDAHLRKGLRHQRAQARPEYMPGPWADSLLGVYHTAMAVEHGEQEWKALQQTLDEAWQRLDFAYPLWRTLTPTSRLQAREARLHEAKSEAGTARDQLAQSQKSHQQTREQLHEAKSEAGTARDQLAQSQESHQQTREQLQQSRDEYERTREELEKLQVELLDARNKVVQVRGELAVKTAHAAMLDQILASRSWRWTRPLRFAMRALRTGVSRNDRQHLKRMVQAKVPTSIKAGTPALAEQQGGMRDYFVWAVVDWHFRIQRPQHIAKELARLGHRVFYISNNFIDRHDPGFAVEALDEDQRLFQINLHLKSSPAIYHAPPTETEKAQLYASLGRLLEWTRSRGCVSVVDHPYWLETAQVPPDVRVVYDCMDHHGGFADNTDDVLSREHELMRNADLLVVTSDWLETEAGKYNSHNVTVRNACEYPHFSRVPQKRFQDGEGRKIIGYYGAIAAWFDLDLVEKVAERFDDCLILLVGADTMDAAKRRLGELPNVQFTGEVPYADLPFYLYAFDVCMLPFQIIELTLATNPVKVYEYLSAGRSVVSVDLPEIRQFGDLVRRAASHEEFLDAISMALEHEPTVQEVQQRRKFASEQTWEHRVRELGAHIQQLPEPSVSVVVVTYNNLELTKECLGSLDLYSDYSNLEIIVVDNASADGTPDFLRQWVEDAPGRKIILNQDNRGFAAANNQGLSVSSGEFLVMLNNDTYVTPGWVATLVNHLRRNPDLGMLGPVTNNIGNEARIEIQYVEMEDMLEVSGTYTRRHAGQLTPLQTAAFFCVMMPRRVYEKVGELDEAFGIGMFEDDDYCRRVHDQGWHVACAEDVFIHHHLSASFSKIKREKRQEMFEANKRIYEAKWGPWVPHRYREPS